VNLHPHALHPTLAVLLPSEQQLGLEFTIPQQLAFGLAYGAAGDRLVSMGLTWQDWSKLGNTQFRLPDADSDVFARGLDDTWGVNLGMRQSLDSRWAVTAGIGYESDPAPKDGVPVFFPVTEQWRLAAGVEHALADTTRLRLMLSVIAQGTATVVQTTNPLPLPGIEPLGGTYEPTRMIVLGFGLDLGARKAPRTHHAPDSTPWRNPR
jgi:long-subunit fatty acid transport protein